jgi:hypothetical protein
MNVYAVIAQGSNEYYDDALLHISTARNHVSLNSLGLPFAQIMAIESAARGAIRDKRHTSAEVYMDLNFFRSLRFDHNLSKNSWSKHAYTAPMASGPIYYVFASRQALLDSLDSPPDA